MASHETFHMRDPDAPVFGMPDFIGRGGIVKNLVLRCRKRQSVHLYAGPKLGKTSLLLHLRWTLEREGCSASYLDLAEEASREALLAGRWERTDALLLDNCDVLLDDRAFLARRRVPRTGNGHPPEAIVWSGGRRWREFVRVGGLGERPLPVPLAIFLDREARELVRPGLTKAQASQVLAHGGTHPYVLKRLRSRIREVGRDGNTERVIPDVQERLGPFFDACLALVKEPTEHALLEYLVGERRPVNPRQAARALDLPTIKPAADVLCYLGLISRWIRDDEATIFANCELFNDWYDRARA